MSVVELVAETRRGLCWIVFRFKGYRIEGLTAAGRATVEALNLNHSRRQRIREVEEAFGLYTPTG
jgi:hypothetical protein